jgi:hypothetical protein
MLVTSSLSSDLEQVSAQLSTLADLLEVPLSTIRIIKATHVGASPSGIDLAHPGVESYAQMGHEVINSQPWFTFIGLAEHKKGSTESGDLSKCGILNLTLADIANKVGADFYERKSQDPLIADLEDSEIFRLHHSIVHLGAYLLSHNISMQGLRNKLPIEFNESIYSTFTPQAIAAAKLVDATVATFLCSNSTPNIIHITNDGSAINAIEGLNVNELHRPHIIDCHTVVPSLEWIMSLPPILQDYMLKTFKHMASASLVVCVYSKRDIENLNSIADYLGIPQEERAKPFIRGAAPSQFREINPNEIDRPLQCIAEDVTKERLIFAITSRLDPIKMDLHTLDGIEKLIDIYESDLPMVEQIRKTTFLMILRPTNFPEEWSVSGLHQAYNNAFEQRVFEVNIKAREVLGIDRELIVLHRDENHNLSGVSPEVLKRNVLPYIHGQIQLGHEVSIQQAANLCEQI